MPGNVYGVANPGRLPLAVGGGDVALPNGVDTVILTSANIIAPTSGFYFPLIIGSLVFLFGAAASTALSIKARIQGNAAFATFPVAPALLVNNATIEKPFIASGGASGSIFFPGGAIIEIVANPTTNDATFKGSGSGLYIMLFHGPDQ